MFSEGVLQGCLNVARAGCKKILFFLSFMRTEMFLLNLSEVCGGKDFLFFIVLMLQACALLVTVLSPTNERGHRDH